MFAASHTSLIPETDSPEAIARKYFQVDNPREQS
jgi:hypothetical protein